MDQFVAMAAEKLGVDRGIVEKAVGIALNLIKSRASDGDFQDLLAKLPGAEALSSQAESGSETGGGGLLGAATGALGGVLGGGGSAMGALAQLQDTGLDSGQLGSLLSLFKDHAAEQAGGELTGRLFGDVPGLDQLIG
jgi:hypothetical protein